MTAAAFTLLALKLTRTALSAPEQSLLESAIEARTIIEQRSDGDGVLVVSPSGRGYLTRRILERDVYVPFHLARVFPGTNTLSAIVQTAVSVALDEYSPICISGSVTFLGRQIPIADLDFCEYYAAPIDQLPKDVISKQAHAPTRWLVEVKVDKTHHTSPWISLAPNFPPIAAETVIKLDYVCDVPGFGAMPASSVILPSEFAADAYQRSFAYQEAVLCAGVPPRSLLDLSELGRYLEFLQRESDKYAEKARSEQSGMAALKALKRQYSFLLLMGVDQIAHGREILGVLEETLTDPAAGAMVLRERSRELQKLSGLAAPDVRSEISRSSKLLTESYPTDAPDKAQESFLSELLDITERTASAIRSIVPRA